MTDVAARTPLIVCASMPADRRFREDMVVTQTAPCAANALGKPSLNYRTLSNSPAQPCGTGLNKPSAPSPSAASTRAREDMVVSQTTAGRAS